MFRDSHLLKRRPRSWAKSVTYTENRVHQLSPYIGKLKSNIARSLILKHTNEGDRILDPFAGSGTIPFECCTNNRHSIAADISDYARILTVAKLTTPQTLAEGLARLDKIADKAAKLKNPDLRVVPKWVREFFHPETLREALRFAEVCREPGNEFYLACLLGILHHQRPGFLSKPSSHLVPYLRTNLFPQEDFPGLYEYRPVLSRLKRKIERALSKPIIVSTDFSFHHSAISDLRLTDKVEAVITSPPYMNALDYVRDNRLRIWFSNQNNDIPTEHSCVRTLDGFANAMKSFFKVVDQHLVSKGKCILIVGNPERNVAGTVVDHILNGAALQAPRMKLIEVVRDKIPDIRRSRRNARGVKTESTLVFKSSS